MSRYGEARGEEEERERGEGEEEERERGEAQTPLSL
jgi:hypothetical protein